MDDPQVLIADPVEAAAPRAASDEPEGIAALLPAMYPSLKSLFRQFHLTPQDAEDILQSALLRLVQQRSLIGNLQGFLFATVRTKIAHHLRRRAAERLVQLADEHFAALVSEHPASRLERRRDARRFLARLPPAVRQIADLRFGAGMTHREIAATLGQTEAGVRQILSRGLRSLRRDLERQTTQG